MIKRIDKTEKVSHKYANDTQRFIKDVHVNKQGKYAEITELRLDGVCIEKERAYDEIYSILTNLDSESSEIKNINQLR